MRNSNYGNENSHKVIYARIGEFINITCNHNHQQKIKINDDYNIDWYLLDKNGKMKIIR
jgi:hypothetical protein